MFAQRVFEMADQQAFALLSGDCNPMHMDALAARRTAAGAPVVHGLHLTLWCLEALAAHLPELPAASGLRLQAKRMVYLGEQVTARIAARDAQGIRLELVVADTITTRLQIATGAVKAPPAEPGPSGPLFCPTAAIDRSAEGETLLEGQVAFASPAAEAAAMFPAASAWLGAARVAALACSTYLVGMVFPGLHSIYGGFNVAFHEPVEAAPALGFRVTGFDPRFSRYATTIIGGGLHGSVDSFSRTAPAEQPKLAALAAMVAPRQFAGSVALVVGGSRGLGETTAKLLAAGGARILLTYAAGRSDAERVAEEIRSAGGDCDLLQFDARMAPAPQLAALPAAPTHLYYFATPHIGRGKHGVFDAAHHKLFLDFYVTGFHALCMALLTGEAGLRALYPSTVFVEAHPIELTEYAMAKIAGEVMCKDMNRAIAGLHIDIARLPRIATDQNASVIPLDTTPAAEAMLPIIGRMHAPR